ncbi:DHA2 family efflux MFS transporter permease subunit [Segnochrobactrum spirostomi]|uniref:DHA2 family efflux MFS transporter permease subunit n=1 Tax=Segnochrobactrum spirostomi TaxID=2608987 RepID=A0A6A7Y2L1_9HYPH|nr:DHA2 family efflux MFS transporter permease subunit [Segnochrobactrum spirostomi]MQT12371.1 DHA2 family efflux MFS transporter permease subunit [Segnochrobactrum spirostomi]
MLAAGGALAMIMIDGAGTVVALPTIQAQLGLPDGAQQWIITVYALTLAATVAIGGHLGDMLGRVRMFVCGVVLFAAGSLICSLSPNLTALLCGRIVEGLGNVTMAPAAALIAADAFGPDKRGKAMGLYSGLGGLAMMCGPILAGALVQLGGWRSVFLINLPLAAITLFMTRVARPHAGSPVAERFDPVHAVLLVAGVGSAVLALQESRDWGWSSPLTLGLLAFGIVCLGIFVALQLRARNPLIDIRRLVERRFAAACLILFCGQFSVTAQGAFGAISLQRVFHFSPLSAGLAMLFFLIPLMLASPLSGVLYDRFGLRVPALIGLALASAGFFLESRMLPAIDFAWLAPALVLIGAGIGLALTQTYTDGTARIPEGARGRAFGTLDTLRQLGGAIGMAAIGTTVVGAERARLAVLAASSAAPGDARSNLETVLTEALYGHADAVRQIKEAWPSLGPALRDSAARSIADGYVVSVTVLALGLVAVGWLLRFQAEPVRAPAPKTRA